MKWIIGIFAAIGMAGLIQAKVPGWWSHGLVINSYTIPAAFFCFLALFAALCGLKGK